MRRTIGIVILGASFFFGAAPALGRAGQGCGAQERCGGGCGGCGGERGARAAGEAAAPRATHGPAGMAEVRDTFHALLGDHDRIRRTVRKIRRGVATTTVSDDPAVAAKIRLHVRQMRDRLERGAGLRHWDPLFVELFAHHEEIAMEIDDVPGGVRVRETSGNPEVVKLIRAHAAAVTEFTERGFDRAHEASPLPEEYRIGGDRAARPEPSPSSRVD